jgi:hypothetical protein
MTSDLSIADLLAALKSDHIPGAPVSFTDTPGPPRRDRRALSSSAARTISFGFLVAPAWTTAVRPSREIDTPARGGTTAPTAGFDRRTRSTRPVVDCRAPSERARTTTVRAYPERPLKLLSI